MNVNWTKELGANIAHKLRECRREGTVGIHVDCLFSNVKFPPDGPLGTNARWVARRNFYEALRTHVPKHLRGMVYGEAE